MKRIKSCTQILLAAAMLMVAGQVSANEGGELPYQFKPDPGHQASVQRGARNFMNYCSGCHSMLNLRYNRIGRDLGISDDLVKRSEEHTSALQSLMSLSYDVFFLKKKIRQNQ